MSKLTQKLASVEADLVSASAQGPAYLHAEIFRKLGEMVKEPDDIEAVLGAILDRQEKDAGWMEDATKAPVMRTVALGTLLAAPTVAAAKFIINKRRKEQGWTNLQGAVPELVTSNPERAQAMYNLLHDSAPSVATNTPIAADLMRQMMAMPQIDLGTIKGMSDMAKNYSTSAGGGKPSGGMLEGIRHVPATLVGYQSLMSGSPDAPGTKTSSLRVRATHIAEDGTPCVFNWGTRACKMAGLTDAFTGSGTTMDQANNAFNFNQQEQGNTLLPLDSVVRELMNKEMELSNREQMIAQQEQQLQQAMQQVQQLSGAYQQQTGVDPNTGNPADAQGQQAPQQGQLNQFPDQAQGQDQGMQDQGMQDQGMQDQGMQDQGMQDQGMQDQGMQDQGMQDAQAPEQTESGMSPEDEQAAMQAMQQQATPMTPAQDNAMGGEQDNGEEQGLDGTTQPAGYGEAGGQEDGAGEPEAGGQEAGAGEPEAAFPGGTPGEGAVPPAEGIPAGAPGEEPDLQGEGSVPPGAAGGLAASEIPQLTASGAPGTVVTKTINVPVQISVKIAETKENPVLQAKAKAFESIQAAMSDLFRP
jgi:hypothetical protein